VLNIEPKMAAMAEEAALNFEDAIELGNFKVNLFPFRELDIICFGVSCTHAAANLHSAPSSELVAVRWLQAHCGSLA
jgi:hypothetical protein